jgi:hypothetical protein
MSLAIDLNVCAVQRNELGAARRLWIFVEQNALLVLRIR